MIKSPTSCEDLGTSTKKSWPYDDYYQGDKDQEGRRNGQGENFWTGAKSLEWYLGNFTQDTMHGVGDYRWRFLDPDGAFVTYEGHMYCNRMHGYGTMSYADGKLFQGIYNNNIRWGPGVETRLYQRQNVGFWCGQQIIRLSWRPSTPSIAPDLCQTPDGKTYVERFRTMLATDVKTIGNVNNAIELLKKHGADPKEAVKKWGKLYPRHCTDLESAVCNKEVFERDYYNKRIQFLKVVTDGHNDDENQNNNEIDESEITRYYAWNDNKLIIQMMKHCYKHDKQIKDTKVALSQILSGPRKSFRSSGQHETDCRTLLMASFLGNMTSVTRLINSDNVYPDVCDMLGNNTVMYATCGDQTKAIQFLVEAGANVDSYNDSCCTPLAIALIRYLCVKNDIITPTAICQALLPPPSHLSSPVTLLNEVEEWKITRDLPLSILNTHLFKTSSKLSKAMSAKKVRSTTFIDTKKKVENVKNSACVVGIDSDDSITEEKNAYVAINNEFIIRLEDLFTPPKKAPANNLYIFGINDMTKEIEAVEDKLSKTNDKITKKVASKIGLGEVKKPSKNMLWVPNFPDEEEFISLTSVEKEILDRLTRIEHTVTQLLADGANPNLVRCPQPALFIAVVSGSANLARHLINYGANVNEKYPQAFGYTPIDLAVSQPFTVENRDLIKSLLECGASPTHVLHKAIDGALPTVTDSTEIGPTLLHAVFARQVETEGEEEIRCGILQLLLKYNCDSSVLYKGRSALDIAVTKSKEVLDIFIMCPKSNLNAKINFNNQTILIKMFSMPFFKSLQNEERFYILTNLLLHGADPLLPSQNGDEKYQNLFQFTQKTLTEMEGLTKSNNSPTAFTKTESKVKTSEKPKKEVAAKGVAVDDIQNYRDAVKLITECARLLYVRWLQSKLVKELVEVIYKFRHRHWNMIIKEHKYNKKATGLWVTPQRCLEICDILSITKKKVYSDKRVLKHLLCIVQFYNTNLQNFRHLNVTAEEKNIIDEQMFRLLKEHNLSDTINAEVAFLKRSYVMPELAYNAEKKFNVCFECSLPVDSPTKIECRICQLVFFCNLECMRNNVESSSCHPCNSYLQ